jgi:hypothetical protein
MVSRTTEWAEHTGRMKKRYTLRNFKPKTVKDTRLYRPGKIKGFCTCETESVFTASRIIKIVTAQTEGQNEKISIHMRKTLLKCGPFSTHI